jgi:hypothetical protein
MISSFSIFFDVWPDILAETDVFQAFTTRPVILPDHPVTENFGCLAKNDMD